MEYKLEWKIAKRILMAEVSGDVTLEDLRNFNTDVVRHIEIGVRPVHLISYGENIRHIPTNLMQIRSIISYIHHPDLGWTIVVKPKTNRLTEFMLSVTAQATGMQLQQVKNLEHGIEVLKKLDESLRCDNSPV